MDWLREAVVGVSDLTSLRGSALVTALEEVAPADLRRDGVDLAMLVKAVDPADLRDDDLRRLFGAVVRLAEQEPELDFASIDASEFTRLVRRASPAQLDLALENRRVRDWLVDEIFRRMQSHVRAERTKGLNTVVRWRVTGGSGEGGLDRYELHFADGTCRVTREMSARPRVTVTVSPADFVRMITGQASPPVLFVTGGLQVSGDLGFAAGLIGYFELPTG